MDKLKDGKKDLQEIEDIGTSEINSYTKFAFKGKMGEMSIAFILGAYFQKAVEGISNYLLMPIIHYAIMTTGGDWRTFVWTPFIGLTFELGKFSGVFFDFFLSSVILYIVYQKILIGVFKDQISTTKACPKCFSQIDQRALRCNFCTSWIEEKNE